MTRPQAAAARKKKKRLTRIIGMITLAVMLIIALFPIYWMLATSFKPQVEVYLADPTIIPKAPTLDAYRALFTKSNYLSGVKNSFIIALTVSLLTILLAVPCSYAISKLRFVGKSFASRAVLVTYLIPAAVLYIPIYMFLTRLGLSNDLRGLMIIYPSITIPYAIWILIPYFSSIPKDLEEASLVDGCGRVGSMLRIVVPLAIPGIITTFIFSFTMCWGEFLYALVSMTEELKKTYPLIINGLIWGDLYPWPQIMAGGICACVPIVVIYMAASKYLIGGLTAGAVKG